MTYTREQVSLAKQIVAECVLEKATAIDVMALPPDECMRTGRTLAVLGLSIMHRLDRIKIAEPESQPTETKDEKRTTFETGVVRSDDCYFCNQPYGNHIQPGGICPR